MKITKTLIDYGKHFEDDTDYRNIYRVTISNRGHKISFKFGDSVTNTLEGKNLDDYSVLACCKLDYYYTRENYPTFEDFADEFGYSTDSISALKTYKRCLKQAEKLHKVFTQEDIEKLPD